MVDIISRRDGPRREDERAQRLIGQNRAAITQIADRLTQGAYSAQKAARATATAEPQPEGKLIHDLGGGGVASADSGDLRIKISLNNRVVAYDGGSGRQVHLLGEIRKQDGTRYFALALTANGFLSELPPEVLDRIGELDGQIIDAACPESLLAEELSERLGYH
ncbi:MAG: hypothetical protein LPJ95_00920 [Paracoccaceae bacterium]|nr:hypothetical protein [Paracoccaceae bacterium]